MNTPPSVGRIVHYTLSASDAEQANRRRSSIPGPSGTQAHIGNFAREGDVMPMLVVRVWDADTGCLNGQVFLDGNDVLWATSALPGDGHGQWRWPPRA